METGDLAELRIVGGHPALDLANTVAPRQPGAEQIEFLSDPDALLRWAQDARIVGTAEAQRVRHSWARSPEAARSALADVRALRALVDQIIDSGLTRNGLDKLGRRWAAAISRSELRPGDGGAVTLTVGTEPASMIADRLADALVDLLRNADLSRLRVCPLEDGGCGFAFLDRSRNLSRRWCSMEDCGTHAKSRRLTQRRRARR